MNLIIIYFFGFFSRYLVLADQKPYFFIKVNGSWKQRPSILLKEGDLLEIRCQIKETTHREIDLVELKKQPFGKFSVLETLSGLNDSKLYYQFLPKYNDSGIYFCYFRGQASIMTLNVVSKVLIRNGTAPSVIRTKDPFSKLFPERTLAARSNVEEGFMICECRFDSSVYLGMVVVSWKTPNSQYLNLFDQYDMESWQKETLHIVGTKLALRSQSHNKKLYGQYSCLFDYKGAGRVKWDVYLKVAPILNLPLIPPPLPLLESGLRNSHCAYSAAANNLSKQWNSACEVLAYPPVAPSHHVWNWTKAENAVAVILSSAQHSPLAAEALKRTLRFVENDSYCPGLIVPQNVAAPADSSTFFWCYAENEVGASGVRWPQDNEVHLLLPRMVWLMVLLVIGAVIAAAALLWCCYCRHSYQRRVLLDRMSRWTSNRLLSLTSLTYCSDSEINAAMPSRDLPKPIR